MIKSFSCLVSPSGSVSTEKGFPYCGLIILSSSEVMVMERNSEEFSFAAYAVRRSFHADLG